MNEYVRLPGRQFNNLVKRYIQHRKAKQLEGKITKRKSISTLKKFFSLFSRSNSKRNIRQRNEERLGTNGFFLRTSLSKRNERLFCWIHSCFCFESKFQRSGQISERISSIRQHRATLARSLTEKFDYLEQESSIFLVRPIFSYQGRWNTFLFVFIGTKQKRKFFDLKTIEQRLNLT